MTKKEIAQNIQNEINWENWENEEGCYFTINEVLYNRIIWLGENLKYEDVESIDTLNMLQDVLKLVNIEDILHNSIK